MVFPHRLVSAAVATGDRTTGAERWSVRAVPAALRDRYVAAGWWTDETLGARRRPVVARRADGDREHLVGDATVARDVRGDPDRGTPARHRADRGRSRARRRRRVPTPELAERPSSRSTGSRSPATSSSRSSTSTDTKKCASSSPRAAPAAYISADRSAARRLPRHRRRCRARRAAGSGAAHRRRIRGSRRGGAGAARRMGCGGRGRRAGRVRRRGRSGRRCACSPTPPERPATPKA